MSDAALEYDSGEGSLPERVGYGYEEEAMDVNTRAGGTSNLWYSMASVLLSIEVYHALVCSEHESVRVGIFPEA